jgi:hypothetical protein
MFRTAPWLERYGLRKEEPSEIRRLQGCIRKEAFALRRPAAWLAACLLVWSSGLGLSGCTRNAPYRTAQPATCTAGDCDDKLIEKHDGYDLAFVEFTERGHVFDRERMNRVLDYVAEQARYDPSNPEGGVFTIVFVHGWKHNARGDDGNVISFRKLLRQINTISRGIATALPERLSGLR